jgi:adenosine kinase
MAKIPKKNKNKKRVVVITCGPNSAFVAEYDFNKEKLTYSNSFAPEYVEESQIVDTNGAGDAFAGGFLSKFVRNESLEQCMRAGHWAASVIIQTRGCQIPESLTYKSSEI